MGDTVSRDNIVISGNQQRAMNNNNVGASLAHTLEFQINVLYDKNEHR